MCIYLCLTNMCVYQWIFYIYKNILSCQNKTVWVLDNSSYIHRCCGDLECPSFWDRPKWVNKITGGTAWCSIRCVRRFLARWWRIVCCFYMFGCWLLWLMFTLVVVGVGGCWVSQNQCFVFLGSVCCLVVEHSEITYTDLSFSGKSLNFLQSGTVSQQLSNLEFFPIEKLWQFSAAIFKGQTTKSRC